MKHDIVFLPTTDKHEETFGLLSADVAPELNVRHDVTARLKGMTIGRVEV